MHSSRMRTPWADTTRQTPPLGRHPRHADTPSRHPSTDNPLGKRPQADTPQADTSQADTPRQTPPSFPDRPLYTTPPLYQTPPVDRQTYVKHITFPDKNVSQTTVSKLFSIQSELSVVPAG